MGEVMGLFHSPNIIKDGLVTMLDAGNSKSYSGSGTTWKDLSTNQQNATMNGNPSFSTATGVSHFDLDGDGDYFEIDNITRTGFEVTFKNTANDSIYARSFVWGASGFGNQVSV